MYTNSNEEIAMDKKIFGIRAKLFTGFISICIITIISVVISLVIIAKTEKNASEVIETELPIYNIFVDLNSYIFMMTNSVQLELMTHNEKYKTDFAMQWENIQKIQATLDSYIKKSSNQSIDQKWQQLKTLFDQLHTTGLKIINTADNHSANMLMQSDFVSLMDNVTSNLNSVNTQVTSGILDIQYLHLQKGSQRILNDMSLLTLFEYAILIISVFASLIIALVTAQKILTPLNKAINIAKAIANGERKIKIKSQSNDETGELLTALDVMQKSISDSEANLQASEIKTRTLFENIVKSANQFSAHSSKVASGDLRQHLDVGNTNNDNDAMYQLGNDLNKMTENLALITKEITQACQYMVSTVEEVRHAVDTQSSGASEQASSINEITASLSEIEKSSMQTMEKAKTLGQSAEQTREKGKLGLDAVDQSVEGMKRIRDKVQTIAHTILDLSKQTQQVGEITSVVNNLAQQSKMLALNASIEAAKAGESGKGFAVVAVEVKNLAEQSEQATSQVQKILESIRLATEKAVMVTEEGTKGVDEGTLLVEQTGDIIRNLNDVIHDTTIASQQIESAVRQESAGIEQITTGMNEINQVTGSFIESVKQTTEAINSLAEIAKNLKSHIDTYKV